MHAPILRILGMIPGGLMERREISEGTHQVNVFKNQTLVVKDNS